MRLLDEQERLIARALIRDPRESDNGIGEATGVNVRTVNRKRQRMEQEGILSFFTHIDLTASGTGQYNTRHVYIIKFRLGITLRKIQEDIAREPAVRSIFTEFIFESHLAEIDGKVALILFVDGESDTDIVVTMHQKMIPSLLRNHGENSIEEVSTMRIIAANRMLRNYITGINIEDGYLSKEWPDEAIYVGKTPNETAHPEAPEPSARIGVETLKGR